MNDELSEPGPSRPRVARHGRFKRHELDLGDGSRLILGVDGTIDHVDDHGSTVHSWTADDAEWADHAIRFGLHPQAPTVTPQGRRVQPTKPPRG